jgi:predicted ATPase
MDTTVGNPFFIGKIVGGLLETTFICRAEIGRID